MSRHFIPISSSPDWAAGVIAKRKMALDGMERRGIGDARYHTGRQQVFVDGSGGWLFHLKMYCRDWNVRYASIIRLKKPDGTTRGYKAVYSGAAVTAYNANNMAYQFCETRYGLVYGNKLNGYRSSKIKYYSTNETDYGSNFGDVCNAAISPKDVVSILAVSGVGGVTVTAFLNNEPINIGGQPSLFIQNVFTGLPYYQPNIPPALYVLKMGCNYDGTEICFTLRHLYYMFSPNSYGYVAAQYRDYHKERFQTYRCQITRGEDNQVSVTCDMVDEVEKQDTADHSEYQSDNPHLHVVTRSGRVRHGSGYYRGNGDVTCLDTALAVMVDTTITHTGTYFNGIVGEIFYPDSPMTYTDITELTESGTVYLGTTELYTQTRQVNCSLSHTSRSGFDYAKYHNPTTGEPSDIDLSAVFAFAANWDSPPAYIAPLQVYKKILIDRNHEYDSAITASLQPPLFSYNTLYNTGLYITDRDYQTWSRCNIHNSPARVYVSPFNGDTDRLTVSQHGAPTWGGSVYIGTLYGLFIDPEQTEEIEVAEDSGNPWVERVMDMTSASYLRRYYSPVQHPIEFVCDGMAITLADISVTRCVSSIKERLTAFGIAHYDNNIIDRVMVKEWDGPLYEVDMSAVTTGENDENNGRGMLGVASIIPGWNN